MGSTLFPGVARGVACIALLILGGCGDPIEIRVVDAKDVTLPTLKLGVDEEEQMPGLWDPSPIEGDKIVGQQTYAFLPAPAGEAPKRGGELRAALLRDIDNFNPFLSSSASASEIQELIFPRLMSEQPNYFDGVPTFVPAIAESWSIAEDNLSIRFMLRECTWSDGTPISSGDVEFSWQAGKSPDVAWVGASIVDFIQDIEIHSPREFTVKYTKSSPYNIMDINDVQIIPKHTFGTVPFGKWQGYANWAELATKACGGPWLLDKHLADEVIALKPNPTYWDKGKPYLDKLTFKIFQNQSSILKSLRAGQIDVMNGVQPHLAYQVLDNKDLWLMTYVARSYGYAGWNCKRFPFKDARVRRAMTHAINREDIVKSQFYGYAEVAAPFIIRSMWASARDVKPLAYDPSKSEALLADAGFTHKKGDGWYDAEDRKLAFVLNTNSGNDVRKAICERIQSDLSRIDVDVEIKLIDFNMMSQKLKKHEFQAYVGGWYIATKIDPKPTFHSISVDGRYNYVNFTDPYIDDLIDRGRTMNISNPAIREEARGVWRAFQHVLHENQPYTMIYEPRGLVGINKRFINVRATSLKYLDNVHEWWIK